MTESIDTATYLKQVRAQYENFPYPPRNPADEKVRLYRPGINCLEPLNHFCYRGRETFATGFRSLIAGGGTGDSAIHMAEQLRPFDNAEVVYLDMSAASMEVAQKRAQIRGLTNITWLHNSLLELPRLKEEIGEFDHINCSGVLHHLDDPAAGLRALKSALKPTGAMDLMVYAHYGRAGIYHLQEALRLLNKHEPDMHKRVANTKALLENLPTTNWFKLDQHRWQGEINHGDIALYDLFLHEQDRAYTFPQFIDWLGEADLRLIDVYNRAAMRVAYRPQSYIKDATLLAHIEQLSLNDQYAIGELMLGIISQHAGYVTHQENVDTIATPDALDNVPFFYLNPPDCAGIAATMLTHPGKPVTLKPAPDFTITITPAPVTPYLFKYLDGRRSLGEIFAAVRAESVFKQTPPAENVLLTEFKNIYTALQPLDWLLFHHHSVPADTYKTDEKLQQPVLNLSNKSSA